MRILYLDLDSLRPDHISSYGYHRNTTPNIDEVAKEGVMFTNYYCTDAPCLPSRSALMSGRFGIHNGVVGHGGTAADMRHEGPSRAFNDRLVHESLPGSLRSLGYKTTTISTFAERHSAWTFNAGFNEVFNLGKVGHESADKVLPVALKWLDDNGSSDDWFLHLNFWDPHTPYRTPDEFGNPFADDAMPEWITKEVFNEHKQRVGQHSIDHMNELAKTHYFRWSRHGKQIETYEDLRLIIDNYDTAIKYIDEHVGKVLEKLEQLGIMEDTAILISADHGENMGELGIYSEHGTADEGTCRIPMIIRWPNGAKGIIDHGLHYHLDLAPTLTSLLGGIKADSWDGESFADSIIKGESEGREYLVISQCAHVCQRSVRFDDWLYIRTYHDGHNGFPKEMLFNIKEDPHEQRNLAENRRDICKDAVYYLNEWHDEMMSTMDFDVDPLWTVMKEGGPLHAKEFKVNK
ncbi:sulfatase-like hydrolase/transferase [Aquibacillus halophilus]|uniref:Sulfatase-like hydrolase/transferase n=1 Tax=Aquibacillus halophilus TaxID=930132 RepID=A0A6A8DHT3_9BACI|nr:sulfatase [Aquibacillus halophilus]MRH43291.1 sulfatase-like hydrolase/transferase [Aquibacillus halophilus]